MESITLFIYTESSLHAGIGSTVSAVDLPIQRERTTQYPIVQGSGIKGALRSQIVNDDKKSEEVERYFGGFKPDKDGKKNIPYAGAFSVGDARILLFPVRSLAGVFAYVTCPAVLARAARNIKGFPAYKLPLPGDNALVSETTKSSVEVELRSEFAVVLEEFSFKANKNTAVDTIAGWLAEKAFPDVAAYQYWRSKIKDSLVVLPDDAFRDFVLNSTEIATRVQLNAAKTVQNGPWTQESLPADTLLMSSIVVRSARDGSNEDAKKVKNWLESNENVPAQIQLGGDETTGQGMVALRWL